MNPSPIRVVFEQRNLKPQQCVIFLDFKRKAAQRILKDTPFSEFATRILQEIGKAHLASDAKFVDSVSAQALDGRSVVAFHVKSDEGVFDRHERLRKVFASHVSRSEPREWLLDFSFVSEKESVTILSELMYLGQTAHFSPQRFGKAQKKESEPSTSKTWWVKGLKNPPMDEIIEASLLGRINNIVKELAELPPNYLHPSDYLARVKAMIKSLPQVDLEFWNEEQLAKKGAGAFLAVSRGSARRDAGILKLSYRPKGSTAQKKTSSARAKSKSSNSQEPYFSLVGKGICFDTGGYNVKTGAYMRHMKADMMGSAVVLGLFLACVYLKKPWRVDAYLALSENHIGPNSFHADEVVTAANGDSIEVMDTDAEGRMVLADTLWFAAQESPDVIFDFATLTGSARYSLGSTRSACFSNRELLLSWAQKVGERSGEQVWPFPCGQEYRQDLKSAVADILQLRPEGGADHIFAATFLRHFVGEKTPWIHLDLNAKRHRGGLGLVPQELNGFGVRWGFEAMSSFRKKDFS